MFGVSVGVVLWKRLSGNHSPFGLCISPHPITGSIFFDINCSFPFSSNHGMHTAKIVRSIGS